MENNPRGKYAFKIVILSTVFVVVLASLFFIGSYLFRNKQMSSVKRVIGVDVSAYQGEINWKDIERQGICFAYIKATEGTDVLDRMFEENWRDIDATSITKGAYMFYDFNANPEEMADFFIKTVPKEKWTLPPVIDIELSGEMQKKAPDKKTVLPNVERVIELLRQAYGKDPIIYTNINTYQTYFTDQVKDTKFWIADLSSEEPTLEGHDWAFWQFTWRGVLNGTDGSTIFTDMNLYNGDLEEFTKEFNPTFLDKL